jgi:hypothetical protein
MVDGELILTEDKINTHTDCVLGQWYYERGRIEAGDLQEYIELEEPHMRLHEATRCAVVAFNQGDIQETKRYIADVERCSHEIVDLLDKLERIMGDASAEY